MADGAGDAPTTDGQAAPSLATSAEDSVRSIVHLLEESGTAVDAYAVFLTLSGLARTLEQLPEAVTRLAEVAHRHHEDGGLRMASGPNAGQPEAALDALDDAIAELLAALGPTTQAMHRVQAALAGVARPDR